MVGIYVFMFFYLRNRRVCFGIKGIWLFKDNFFNLLFSNCIFPGEFGNTDYFLGDKYISV